MPFVKSVVKISISVDNAHVVNLLYPFYCLDALKWLSSFSQSMSGGLHVHESRTEPKLRLHKL